MKKHNYKIVRYTMLMFVLSLPFSLEVLADAKKNQSTNSAAPSAENKSLITKQTVLALKKQEIVSEARDSVMGTRHALLALGKNDTKTALASLQSVSKKLDVILSKKPKLELAVSDIDVDIFDFEGDVNTLEKGVKEAKDLLDSGKLQGARHILANLASEMKISTYSIPLATYPSAIKDATADIKAGKINAAALVLDGVLNTLDVNIEIIPLPILRAEGLLTVASELENTEDMSKEKNRDQVLKYADEAKEKLKIAELLGYGSKDNYHILYTVIDDIKNTMNSEKSAGTWSKIKQTIEDLKNEIKKL